MFKKKKESLFYNYWLLFEQTYCKDNFFFISNKKISPFILNPLDILVQKIAHEKIIKESLEIIEQSVENLYKNANDMKIDSFDLINSNLFKKIIDLIYYLLNNLRLMKKINIGLIFLVNFFIIK